MEAEKAVLYILFISILMLCVFASLNIINNKHGNLEVQGQKNKITVSESAPAALSGKWKLIK